MAIITSPDSDAFDVTPQLFVPVAGPAIPEDELVLVDAAGNPIAAGGRVIGVTGAVDVPPLLEGYTAGGATAFAGAHRVRRRVVAPKTRPTRWTISDPTWTNPPTTGFVVLYVANDTASAVWVAVSPATSAGRLVVERASGHADPTAILLDARNVRVGRLSDGASLEDGNVTAAATLRTTTPAMRMAVDAPGLDTSGCYEFLRCDSLATGFGTNLGVNGAFRPVVEPGWTVDTSSPVGYSIVGAVGANAVQGANNSPTLRSMWAAGFCLQMLARAGAAIEWLGMSDGEGSTYNFGLSFRKDVGGVLYRTANSSTTMSSTATEINRWHLWTYNVHGDGRCEVFCDKTKVAENTSAGTVPSPPTSLRLAVGSAHGGGTLAADIAVAQISLRAAWRTAAEVLEDARRCGVAA